MTAAASAAPVQRKANIESEMLREKRADRPVASKQQQQGEAGDDGRKHERQMHDRVKRGVSGKAPARQRVSDENGERQGRERRDACDLHAQADGGNFLRRKIEHAHLSELEFSDRYAFIFAASRWAGSDRSADPAHELAFRRGADFLRSGFAVLE